MKRVTPSSWYVLICIVTCLSRSYANLPLGYLRSLHDWCSTQAFDYLRGAAHSLCRCLGHWKDWCQHQEAVNCVKWIHIDIILSLFYSCVQEVSPIDLYVYKVSSFSSNVPSKVHVILKLGSLLPLNVLANLGIHYQIAIVNKPPYWLRYFPILLCDSNLLLSPRAFHPLQPCLR